MSDTVKKEKKVYTVEETKLIRDNTKVIIATREEILLGELGAIQAYRVCPSIASSVTIREQSKLLDRCSVELRAELIAEDKTRAMVIE